MKIIGLMLILIVSSYGCAVGSATAAYSMRAKTAEELTSESKKSIIDEAVSQSYEKMKAYIDGKIHNLKKE